MTFHCEQCNTKIVVIYCSPPANFNDLGSRKKDLAMINQYCEGCKIFARTGRWLGGFGPVPAAVQKCIDEGTRGLA